jgi:LysM repeat protein
MTHTSNTWQNLSSPFVTPHTFSSAKSLPILARDFHFTISEEKSQNKICIIFAA